MKRYILSLILACAAFPVLMAQEEVDSYGDNTTEADDETSVDIKALIGDPTADESDEVETTSFRQRMTFTRRELDKITDPRIRDLYWYALNDTTDRKRYLRAHYAFNSWNDNWSFEIRGGAQSVLMDATKEKFDLGPQVELGFMKDVHPYWGLRGDVTWSKYTHELYTPHLSTMISDNGWSNYVGGSAWWQQIQYVSMGARVAVMMNLVNMYAGREMLYSPVSLRAYAGAGFIYAAKSLSQRDGSCLVPQWFFGLQGGYNITQRYSLILDGNCSWQGDDLEGYTTQNSTWKFAVTLGISYKFSKVIHFQRLGYDDSFAGRQVVDASDDEDNMLQTVIEMNSTQEQANLPSTLIEAAFFQIDRIELQHTYVLNLGFYARLINDHPNQKFLVKGFADIEIGSSKRNEWLAEQRAKVVADVLEKTYGVNPDQLIVGGGDLDYDFPFLRENGHHRFNRCAIVCPLDQNYQIIDQKTFQDKSELMDGRVSAPKKNY